MRIPTFSRQSDTTTETEDRAPVAARPATSSDRGPAAASAEPAAPVSSDRAAADRRAAERASVAPPDGRTTVITRQRHGGDEDTTADLRPVNETDHPDLRPVRDHDTRHDLRPGLEHGRHERDDDRTENLPGARPAPAPVTGPKPRASLLATLGLIAGVAGALLVLSGPLLGYGIGVAGLALVLSLLGLRATRKRHVAGKTDALIGMVLALAAIVVGVFALTGSLSWLGTDMQPVNNFREWLDAQFVNRF
ncbi:Yip1 family protein [Actinoplanes sp. N902-109]|uniref:Yip1 family protein n=1 Tax=Actinoplanes sp. (strain N902-109) TaxID=649831 RepID=UPI0003293F5C|nr:Yip1 family protein [Actinoplanes sp. N902-109]AGL20690.1 thrombospondin type 3 repeat-containing protein [Actinoplanes sp. N902-109]